LKKVLEKRNKPLDLSEVTHILDGVHKALHYAHKLEVCHCDIKPANILLKKPDEQAIMSDFGLAQMAHQQGSGGTLPYMAPELFQGGKVSVASDIYALGVTLYQVLSCRLPFSGETGEQLIRAHISKMPPPIQSYNPELPTGIASVIEKALAKDPGQRYKSVTDLWMDFSRGTQASVGKVNADGWLLLGVRGEMAGRKLRLSSSAITIGRSERNLLRLRDKSVSRDHAVISCRHGNFFIRDKGSSLGTYINGHGLHNKEAELRDGDRIKIGISDEFEVRSGSG
jgi:serine/threonine protein kinase